MATEMKRLVPIFQFSTKPEKEELKLNNKLRNGIYNIDVFPCALCGASENHFLDIAEPAEKTFPYKFSWGLCRSCGLLQLTHRFDASSLTHFYQSGDYHRICMGDLPLTEHFELYYKVAGPSLLLDLELFNLKISGSNILDIGCGPGAALKYLKESGASVRGFDLDPKVIEYGKRYIHEIEVGDALTWDSSLEEFDYILMGCVLPHLSDPVAFLKTLHNRMHYSQKLIISAPNLDQCHAYSPGPFYEFLHIGHIHYFNAVTIERCANSAGFIVDQIIPRGAAMSVMLTKSEKIKHNENNAFFGSLTSIRFADLAHRGIDKPIQKKIHAFYRNPRRLMRSAIFKLRHFYRARRMSKMFSTD